MSTFLQLQYLRDQREGRSLWRMLHALAYIVHEWCTYTGERKLIYGKKDEGYLGAIYFCKLSTFVCRIWSEMFSLTGGSGIVNKVDHLAEKEFQKLVSFKSPYTEFRGRHGRTPGRYDGKSEEIYINQIVYECVRREITDLFDVEVDSELADAPLKASNAYTAKFKYGTPLKDSKLFLKRFTDRERDILENLANAIKRIGLTQIRALGTHDDHDNTCRDVIVELNPADSFMRKVETSIHGGGCFYENSRELEWCVDEACRKSRWNYTDYEEAFDKMQDELRGNQLLLNAFLNIQSPPNLIWHGDVIEDCYKLSNKLLKFAKGLHAIAYYRNHIVKRKEVIEWKPERGTQWSHRWHEGVNPFKSPGEIFIDDRNELRSEASAYLLKDLKLYRRDLSYMATTIGEYLDNAW